MPVARTKLARLGRRALLRWMSVVRRRAPAVVVLSLAVGAAGLGVTVARLTINTSVTDMLSPDLPFRQNERALEEAFPQIDDTLSVVIEGPTAEAVDLAARRLALALKAETGAVRDVYYPQGDPFFRRNGLLFLDLTALQALADRLAEAQPLLAGLRADPSLRGLAETLEPVLDDPNHEAVAALAPALEAVAESAEAVEAGSFRPVSWRALTAGEDAEAGGHRAFLTVQPVLDSGGFQPAAPAIAAIRRLADANGEPALEGVQVRVTGQPAIRQDELVSVKDSMGLVSAVSVVLVTGLLAVGLGSLRLIVATVATLAVGLAATAGFATLAVGELNLISVTFAVLFVGLSVDFGIHFALRYREAVQAGHGPPGALNRAALGTGGALTLAALAAAIGFFSFLPTSYRGLSELGLISGVGMFIALASNLTVLPALLTLMPIGPASPGPANPGPATWITANGLRGSRLGMFANRLAERWPRAVLLAALVLAAASAATLPAARFDDDPLNLRDPASESVAALLDLFEDPNIHPYAADMLVDDLDAAAAVTARLEALPQVSETDSLENLVPEDQEEKITVIEDASYFMAPLLLPPAGGLAPGLEDRVAAARALAAAAERLGAAAEDARLATAARRLEAALARLAGEPVLLEQFERAVFAWLPALIEDIGTSLGAEPFTAEDLPEGVRDRWMARDGRARIEILPAEDLRDQGARRRFVEAVRAVAPTATGGAVSITEGGRAVLAAFFQAAVIAVLAIVALLLAHLRRLPLVLLVLAPLALATLLTVAATVVLDLPFNFANVIVLPLLFGLGVAGSLHIVLRARESGAMRILATSTPRAVLFSALTTIGSFGALALASHRGTASMGLLLAIAIALTILSTLVVLPAFLHWANRRGAGGSRPDR